MTITPFGCRGRDESVPSPAPTIGYMEGVQKRSTQRSTCQKMTHIIEKVGMETYYQ